MARKHAKNTIITFKVDGPLSEAIRAIPNRSEFIRTAILAALNSVCPLCQGTGVLTPNQQRHWREFSATHSLQRCERCDELRLTCAQAESSGKKPTGRD